MDHAVPPAPVDGLFEAILAVRDLCGEPLLWEPRLDQTAQETIAALELLFAERGAPLVLKSDNGPGFRSEDTAKFLEAHGVWHLFSPVRTPSYNGSCEASIRHLKRQTAHEAARHGRAGAWQSADLRRARALRAALAGAAPSEPVTESVRMAFAETVRENIFEVEAEFGYARVEGTPGSEDSIMRTALSRALLEHGFLHIRRRRLPLPNCRLFRAKIS
jgi:transposase InsO family protein